MVSQAEIHAYLKEVKRNCPYAFRKKLKNELESNLLDYLDEHPYNSMEDIIVHFGLPERYAREYIRSLDDGVCQRIIDQSKFIKRCVLIGLLAIALIVAAAACRIMQDFTREPVYYYRIDPSPAPEKAFRTNT